MYFVNSNSRKWDTKTTKKWRRKLYVLVSFNINELSHAVANINNLLIEFWIRLVSRMANKMEKIIWIYNLNDKLHYTKE